MWEQVERRYQEDFDDKLYITLRNERRDGCFHPSQLPRKLVPIADVLDPTSDIKAPTLRMLNRVPQHQRWLACLQACHDADTATPHPESLIARRPASSPSPSPPRLAYSTSHPTARTPPWLRATNSPPTSTASRRTEPLHRQGGLRCSRSRRGAAGPPRGSLVQ